jgi:hypothetical protein
VITRASDDAVYSTSGPGPDAGSLTGIDRVPACTSYRRRLYELYDSSSVIMQLDLTELTDAQI